MINTRLLKTTLMAASAAIALTAAPAWADDETTTGWSDGDGVALGTGDSSVTSYSDNITINYGDDFSGINASNAATITQSGESGSYTFSGSDSEGYQGSWVIFKDANQSTNNYTFSVSSEISGTGFLGVAIKVGDGGATGIIDLTDASATNFSGQLMALNVWNSSVKVKLGGDSWANTEYVFSGVSREWWDPNGTLDASASNTTSGDFLALAGNGNNDSSYEVETLELSSNTSLAGITGTEYGYTDSIDFNSREAITAAESGTTLTLTGSGTGVEYAFYGSVGTESIALDIAKTGSAKQTLGGTNFLGNVSVSDGELVLGTLSVTTTTISGDGDISITSVDFGTGGSTSRTLTIGTEDSATTVTVGSVTVSGESTITVASGSVLDVTGALTDSSGHNTAITGDGKLSADSMTLSHTGGYGVTISVAELEVSGALTNSSSDSVTISSATATVGSISNSGSGTFEIASANLNIGSGGITGNEVEITDTTVGLSSGTSSATISAGLWLNGSTGTTFNTAADQEMTLSGALTGNGALVKTGEGTLTLSGSNSYYGGTTISEGTVVAASSSALGNTTANSVTINGGQLVISGEDVTVSNAITVVLDSYIMSDSEISLADTDGATVYAIVLDDGGALSEDATISVSATSAFMNSLEDGETYEFAIISGDFSGSYDYSALEAAGYTVDVDSGVIWVTTPEPSMFGLLAGLGALGLVATRRRRNRKA